jgi:GDP-mannose 6-dehydrogenase
MKVSLFGLGYVGCVTAACLAKCGHEVWGVDINTDKVGMINAGKSPIIEKGLAEIIQESRCSGRFRATADVAEAVLNTEISLVCVGTPSNGNGSLDLRAVKAVASQIGETLRNKDSYHCVVFRSTVLPGTVRNVLIPLLTEASQKAAHSDFDVCFNPEFLREGSAIKDFYHPPFTAVGCATSRGADAVARLYGKVEAPVEQTNYEVAEMLKYACNGFHALKVAFANEIGSLCKGLKIDSHSVMDLFAQDTKLNISKAYLKPGFAFGGSCLPKDLRALLYKSKELDLTSPLLTAVLESNQAHIQRLIDRILSTRQKKVGILGLSFKPGTDDLRDSPTVALVESLLGKGCRIKIFDSEVSLAKIFGANKAYIEHEISHISTLVCATVDEVLQDSEVIVVCKDQAEFKEALEPYLGTKKIFDLVRVIADPSQAPDNYDGICW